MGGNNEKSSSNTCVVAIDLGSNTLRSTWLECAGGSFLGSYEKIVATADGLARTGRISDDTLRRIVEALKELSRAMPISKCIVRAVATEALRRAENRDEILEAIARETGISFETISGEEEIRLAATAVMSRLGSIGIDSDSMVIVDIGGASTEFYFHYGEKEFYRSFDIGIVTLSQSCHGVRSLMVEKLSRYMESVSDWIGEIFAKNGKTSLFVATAGTPTTVANFLFGGGYYRDYDPDRINGVLLSLEDVAEAGKRLERMDEEERSRAVGAGRSDLIFAGIEIYLALFDLLGNKKCVVIDDGLREGVALQLCRKLGSLDN